MAVPTANNAKSGRLPGGSRENRLSGAQLGLAVACTASPGGVFNPVNPAFTGREAAQILDSPVGTVKSRCARGRARLAELLSDLAPGNRPAAPPVQRTVSDSGIEKES